MSEFCHIHFAGGPTMPCPWPDCINGHDKDVYTSSFPIGRKFSYKRESLIGNDGLPRFFWISDDDPYAWVIRQPVQGELFRISKPTAAPIFHYTSLEGFKGIIESQDFWLTESSFLNDSTEIHHGLELAREVFTEFAENNNGPISELLDGFSTLDKKLRPRTNIACFSSARDNLSQWRAYSGSGIGVSLGFTQQDFLYKTGFPRSCQLVPVLYSDSEKRSLWKTFAMLFNEAYRKDSVREISVEQRDGSVRTFFPNHDYVSSMYSLLYGLAASCKDSAFEDEREIRLFYSEDSEIIERFNLTRAVTRFRSGNCFLAPYTTLGDIRDADHRSSENFNPKLSLCEVVVGPHPRSELAIASIRKFLDLHGYSEVPVNPSAAPYR